MIQYFYRDGTPMEGDLLGLILEWGRLNENDDYRVVGFTELEDAVVSTVWLGIDYGWGVTERPIIFETMVFGGTGNVARYSTEDEAKAGHEAIVKALQEAS